MLTDRSRAARTALAADLLALALFVVVGMRSHRTAAALVVFVRTAAPLALAWLATAALVRTYRPPRLARLVVTWIVAVPLGVLARAAITGGPTGQALATFIGVALVFTLLFLGVGRLALAVGSALVPGWTRPQ